VSTIPAGVVGLLLKDYVTGFLLSPRSAALFLAVNGLLLLLAEGLRKKAKASENLENNDKRIAGHLSWWQAAKVGFLQILALIPGFSRTGSTLAGGLMVGLSHEDSLRYSFLLATPIIGAAALLEIPPLLTSGNHALIEISLAGAVAAAIAAWFSIKFLTGYFKTKTLTPFAIYCVAVGVISLLFLR
jgi:undecaprenyl-diphosphatase